MTEQAKSWFLVNLETKEYLYKNGSLGANRMYAEVFDYDNAESKQKYLGKSGINVLIHGVNTEL